MAEGQQHGAAPLGKQLKNHKTELLVGGAGLAVALALYTKQKGGSSSSSASPATTGAPSSIVYLPQTGTAGEVGSPSFEQPYGPPPAAATTSPAKAPFTPPATEKLVGSGYTVPQGASTVTGSTGGQFEPLPNWDAAQGVLASGGQIEFQPTPGVFVPGGANLKPGTQQFEKVPGS